MPAVPAHRPPVYKDKGFPQEDVKVGDIFIQEETDLYNPGQSYWDAEGEAWVCVQAKGNPPPPQRTMWDRFATFKRKGNKIYWKMKDGYRQILQKEPEVIIANIPPLTATPPRTIKGRTRVWNSGPEGTGELTDLSSREYERVIAGEKNPFGIAWSQNSATESYVDTAISNLVDSSPSTLNTLNELAEALNDDANFATTVTNALATKANTNSLATVATTGSYNDLTSKPTVPTNLNSLTDVSITTPLNQHIVVYNSETSTWENRDPIIATGIVYKAGFPASKTSTGTLGQIAIDGANGTMYVCTGTNTWQKISLNSANFSNPGGFA